MQSKFKLKILIFTFFYSFISYSQSDFEKILKGGEILVNGLSFFKNNKSETKTNTKNVESICVKNKLTDKITFTIVGQDEDGNIIKKELIIQKDGKECFLELPKGIYTYEIILSNKEIFKKGEYKFNEETTIMVKID
jgi:hypothetical protein